MQVYTLGMVVLSTNCTPERMGKCENRSLVHLSWVPVLAPSAIAPTTMTVLPREARLSQGLTAEVEDEWDGSKDFTAYSGVIIPSNQMS